ncbi:anaerobic ribonucleoside-triphosphate reductase activating protein [Massilia solisilvae]|uniref:Anaerobic ribonucleoside-triphosphate reductase activating protein n=1 Tax=Massilia solisilvae TaxID=1811225 RepID=A0ABT2BQP6_9BURK|nr:anaerobic ribonucleoside-triphosphate reductase activating protein [Massilia solisilvae]MCS0610839.1 anaerobic ribonucleoside-triphosphate reductase activating protein [Massilia solisilvae]
MREHREVAVGGLAPFTTIDFPGRLAAVVFTQGCPWRCGYCHNPHLLPREPAAPGATSWQQVLAWLHSRRGLLDGVVFSGGEPLLQRGLPDALAQVRALGFATALHTGGAYPERLQAALPLLDWVGFDVKAPFDAYERITGADSGDAARESLRRLLASSVAHEVRCTVDPSMLDPDDVERMSRQVAGMGVRNLVLQPVRRDGQRISFPARPMTGAVQAAGLQVELRVG